MSKPMKYTTEELQTLSLAIDLEEADERRTGFNAECVTTSLPIAKAFCVRCSWNGITTWFKLNDMVEIRRSTGDVEPTNKNIRVLCVTDECIARQHGQRENPSPSHYVQRKTSAPLPDHSQSETVEESETPEKSETEKIDLEFETQPTQSEIVLAQGGFSNNTAGLEAALKAVAASGLKPTHVIVIE